MGRHSLFTPEAAERFLEAIRVGSFREVAARRAGWSERTRYRIFASTSPAALEFRAAVERAEADHEVLLGATVQKAALTNPRWALAMLERRYRGRWSPRAQAADAASADEPSSTADEVVVLDPTMVEDIVSRLLADRSRPPGQRSAVEDVIAKFEDRAPPRTVTDGEGQA